MFNISQASSNHRSLLFVSDNALAPFAGPQTAKRLASRFPVISQMKAMLPDDKVISKNI
jgi:hypothetical protein